MNLTDFFTLNKIELYASLDFKNVRVIDSHKLQRYPDFSPKSVLIMAVPYFTGFAENNNISKYAIPRDYHLYFKELFSNLTTLLSTLYPNNTFLPYADSSPIDERAAAAISGIGFIGKNGLLITEKYGSFVFLGEIISDLECDKYFWKTPEIYPTTSCKNCNACITHCPRKKIGTCLSELTQKKGMLTDDEASFLIEYQTLWGCDICQDVCPYNKNIHITPIDFFKQDTIERLDSELVENMPKEKFVQRAWAWRGRKTILRNIDIYNKRKKT